MALRPLRPCAAPRCPALVRDAPRCPTHQVQRARAYDAARADGAERARGWRLRQRYLAEHPACESCGRAESLRVHHRLPRKDGGADSFDNFVTLCESCHQRVHAALRRR